ncbi:MAG: amidohydrolase family protein [Gammaproteobacteria bacterium]|nr:amidohydrolase family protein [Gammaproteobacteria bacterium]
MFRSVSLAAAILFGAACTPEPSPVQGEVAFVGAHVIDVAAGEVRNDWTVVVDNGWIVRIGPSAELALSEDVPVIDGTGRFLAPGLADMHAHVFNEHTLILYLANGITTIRNMWGDPEALALRQAVEDGRVPGPRLVTAGQLLDGAPKIWAGSTEVSDTGAAAALVAQQAADGYDFVKVYSRLTPEVFDAMLAAAAEHGIEASGHVPQAVPFMHAVRSGMRTAEHMIGMLSSVFADESWPNPDLAAYDERAAAFVGKIGRGEIDPDDLVDPEKVARVAAELRERDFWFVPTIDVMKNFTSLSRRRHPDAVRYLTPVDRQLVALLESTDFAAAPPDVKAGEDILYAVRARVLRDLRRQGAKVLVGTDDSMLSGFVVVDEMQSLVDAGLTRADVLRSATLEAANYLGEPGRFGEIREGAAADLILVDGNPLEDLEALRFPRGVMRAGLWYTRAELDGVLEELAAKTEAVEAEFAAAPPMPPGAGARSDFLSDAGGAASIASSRSGDGTVVTAAIRDDADWRTFRISSTVGVFTVEEDGSSVLRAESGDRGWRLTVGSEAAGEALPGDAAAVLTGTAADILILDAAVGLLPEGKSRNLVAWRCGPRFDCSESAPERLTVTGLGTHLIRGHRIWESTNVYDLVPPGGGPGSIRYWMAPPGLFSGGPARLETDGVQHWRRIR